MLRTIVIQNEKFYLDHDNTENYLRLCIFFLVMVCLTLPADSNAAVHIMIMLQMVNEFILKRQIIRKKHDELN